MVVTAEAADHVVRPWGVLSLSESDPFFHPKHLDLENYYYDEAYHNGDLWIWLSGSYVSALNRAKDGFGQTRMMMDEILDEGAVGTLQEIRDGAQAASNDEFGGATSQAWSLAELLRAAGWRTSAVVSNYVARERSGLAAGFDHYDARFPQLEAVRRLPERTAAATTERAEIL